MITFTQELEEIITESDLCNSVPWKSFEERKQRVNQLRDAIQQLIRERIREVKEGNFPSAIIWDERGCIHKKTK